MCKKISAAIIKKLGHAKNKVGIYYRNGHVLDTINGIIKKVEQTENLNYELRIPCLEEQKLKGNINYETFHKFIKMKAYFNTYYKIYLYWDQNKTKCIYNKTTPIDQLGGWGGKGGFTPQRNININNEIFKKIKFVPDLQETLDSFVDKVEVSQFYKDNNDKTRNSVNKINVQSKNESYSTDPKKLSINLKKYLNGILEVDNKENNDEFEL